MSTYPGKMPAPTARRTAQTLAEAYPDPATELHFTNPLELLIATVLSAQSTDERVNAVTPALFARYPDAPAFAGADRDELESLIQTVGLYRSKAASIQGLAQRICEEHGGEVPRSMEELVALPGVGRKTASVLLGHWFDEPAIAVDTHVLRLARRLGLTDSDDPVRVEADLKEVWPRDMWADTGLRLIMHGREVCPARKPKCDECALWNACVSRGAF